MKKTFKKILAGSLAGIMAMSLALGTAPLQVNAGQDASGFEAGTAYLNLNTADWSDFSAEYKNAVITGDGSYTVSMECADGVKLGMFNALEVADGEATLGTGSVVTVDSIKINGEEVELQGESYTCSADCGGVTTRVNIWNVYNSPDGDEISTAGDDNHRDQRTTGDLKNATACLLPAEFGSTDDKNLATTDIKSMEVSFTVSNFGVAGEVVDTLVNPGFVEGTDLMEGTATAHLVLNKLDWSEFEAEYVDADITGNGTYTVSMTAKEPIALGQFNALQINNGELIMGNATIVTVTKITIDGTEVELQGPSYTCSADGGAVTTRVNLHNVWNAPDPKALSGDDSHFDQRAVEDLATATACLIPAEYGADAAGTEAAKTLTTIEVEFEVSNYGMVALGTAGSGLSADLDGVYNAYLGLQAPKYSFRDAYDNESTGFGTALFNQITFQGDVAGGSSVPATINDAEIKGNGSYSVSITGIEWPEDEFADQQTMRIIMLSTDIPNSGEIVIDNVVLKIDGAEVKCNPIVNTESKKFLQIQLQSEYNAEIKEIGFYPAPFSDIEISFNVSGMNYDNEEAAASSDVVSTDAVSTDTVEAPAEKSGNGPLVGGIVGAVAILGGAGAAFATKKKKDN